MKIVIATDSFKGTLTSLQAGEAIREGVRRIWPRAKTIVVPMADGGAGTVTAVLAGAGGQRHSVEVLGPLGRPVTAEFGLLPDGQTAVIEMAASSGLSLLDVAERDPMRTSTYGTGQQILAALKAGASRLLIGLGDSATIDGGCGCAQALGIRFIDSQGTTLPRSLGGGDLDRIAHVDWADRDERIKHAKITALYDVANLLCGERGAAREYGPQKGATPDQVERLDRNLSHLAQIIENDLNIKVAELNGGGAAGGLGAGLVAFAGAELRSGVEFIIEVSALAHKMLGAGLAITGEGRIDAQSWMGKVVSGVAGCAKANGVPVIAIAGSAGAEAEACLGVLDAFYTIREPGDSIPKPGQEAMRDLAAQSVRHLASWAGV